MGIIGKFVTKTVIKAAGNAAMLGTVVHMEKERSAKALVEKSGFTHKLVINQKTISAARRFIVYDQNKNKLYQIKTDLISMGTPCIRLYDINDDECGRVTKEIPLVKWPNPEIYRLYLDGEYIGKVNKKLSVKQEFEIDFRNWKISGNLLGFDFKITDDKEITVIQIHKAFESKDAYVLEMNNPEDECIALLLLMTVELMLHTQNK